MKYIINATCYLLDSDGRPDRMIFAPTFDINSATEFAQDALKTECRKKIGNVPSVYVQIQEDLLDSNEKPLPAGKVSSDEVVVYNLYVGKEGQKIDLTKRNEPKTK